MTDSSGRERTPLNASCPAAEALTLIRRKWAASILGVLEHGPTRNADLAKKLPGVSQKILTQELRSLMHAALVVRSEFEAKTPHVEYSLTDRGRTLSEALRSLDAWSLANGATPALQDVPAQRSTDGREAREK